VTRPGSPGRWRRAAAAGLFAFCLMMPGGPVDGAPAPQHLGVFVGYSYLHAGDASLNGWRAEVSRPVRARWDAVLDVAGHYGSFAGADLNQAELLIGARRSWQWGGIRPFASLGLGIARQSTGADGPDGRISDSHTRFALAPGIGADRRIGQHWSVRGTVDLLLVSAEGAWDTDPRVSAGAVYRFGR
jgi:hypothetical protein